MAFHRKALSLPRPNPKSGGNNALRGLKSRGREGGTLHIEKALSRFVFWLFRNYHTRIGIKNIAGVTSRGVVYTLRSVQEVRVTSMHTLRVYYILQRGCFSVCLFQLAVVGHEQQTGRCKHPRFLYVGFNRVKTT